MDRSYNRELVSEYAKRVVSVCIDQPKIFCVHGTWFRFVAVKCPQTARTLLRVQIDIPHENAANPRGLVLLIEGHKPYKDIPFSESGKLETPIGWFRLNTRLAIRNPNKRRRKYIQEKKHLAEQLETI